MKRAIETTETAVKAMKWTRKAADAAAKAAETALVMQDAAAAAPSDGESHEDADEKSHEDADEESHEEAVAAPSERELTDEEAAAAAFWAPDEEGHEKAVAKPPAPATPPHDEVTIIWKATPMRNPFIWKARPTISFLKQNARDPLIEHSLPG